MDPLELRRRNFIPPHDVPARDRDRHRLRLGQLRRARSTSCSSTSTSRASASEQERAARRGRPPRHRVLHLHRDLRPRAVARVRPPAGSACRAAAGSPRMVRVHPTGAVTVYTGTSPHGQGHETGFAQIVADRLGVDPRAGRGHPRRHGDRARWASAPTARARWPSAARRSPARPTRSSTRRRRSSRTSSRRRPRTSRSRDGKFQVKGSPGQGA